MLPVFGFLLSFWAIIVAAAFEKVRYFTTKVIVIGVLYSNRHLRQCATADFMLIDAATNDYYSATGPHQTLNYSKNHVYQAYQTFLE